MKLELYNESFVKPTITIEDTNQLLDFIDYNGTLILADTADMTALHELINRDAEGSVNWDTAVSHIAINGKALLYVLDDRGHDIYLIVESFSDSHTVKGAFKGSPIHKNIAQKLNRKEA